MAPFTGDLHADMQSYYNSKLNKFGIDLHTVIRNNCMINSSTGTMHYIVHGAAVNLAVVVYSCLYTIQTNQDISSLVCIV